MIANFAKRPGILYLSLAGVCSAVVCILYFYNVSSPQQEISTTTVVRLSSAIRPCAGPFERGKVVLSSGVSEIGQSFCEGLLNARLDELSLSFVGGGIHTGNRTIGGYANVEYAYTRYHRTRLLRGEIVSGEIKYYQNSYFIEEYGQIREGTNILEPQDADIVMIPLSGKSIRQFGTTTAPYFFESEGSLYRLSSIVASDGGYFIGYEGSVVSNADLDSFKVLSPNYSVDSHGVYFRDKVMPGADPTTFRVHTDLLGGFESSAVSIATDSRHVYAGADVILDISQKQDFIFKFVMRHSFTVPGVYFYADKVLYRLNQGGQGSTTLQSIFWPGFEHFTHPLISKCSSKKPSMFLADDGYRDTSGYLLSFEEGKYLSVDEVECN